MLWQVGTKASDLPRTLPFQTGVVETAYCQNQINFCGMKKELKSRQDKSWERGSESRNSPNELSGDVKAYPERFGSPPEASFASSSERAARSVNSQCKSRVMELRNPSYRWGLRRREVRGQHRHAAMSLAWRPGRSLRAGRMHKGFAGNLGEPKASLG